MLSRRGFMSLSLLLLTRIQTSQKRVEFLSYDRVAPVLSSNSFSLPRALAGSGEDIRKAWPSWLQAHDREIRSRIIRGEEDTLVNFILFGVSFTNRPRISPADPVFVSERIDDFLKAIEVPSTDRLKSLQNLLAQLGYDTRQVAQRDRLRRYLSDSVSRYLAEWRQYQAAASSKSSASLYKTRGLSTDTDFRPNYAIEQGLSEVKRRGLLKSVKRVAVIGPGLDFTDKDAGFDYYPLQTLQPFAVIDSLLRLDMARSSELRVSVFDISSQTLDHVNQAVIRARSKQAYTLQLVLDRTQPWNAAATSYWRRMGERIGSETAPLPAPPQIQSVDRRAVRIRRELVALLEPQSLNIVSQHVEAPAEEKFDLIVATNIFVYYDRFELALALLNVESMLSPTGVMLTNDVLEDYSGIRLRPVGSVSVPYTATQADTVRIYSVPTFRPQLPPG
jgi:hypothetical protein